MGRYLLSEGMGLELSDPILKLVFLSLCHRASDKTGACWPSISVLSKDTGVGVRTVYRKLNELKKMGLVAIESRAGRSSVYRVCWSKTIKLGEGNIIVDVYMEKGSIGANPPAKKEVPLSQWHTPLPHSHPEQYKEHKKKKDLILGELSLTGDSPQMKLKDLMGKDGKIPTKQYQPKTVIGALEHIWKRDLPEVCDSVSYVAPLTQKQKGQLSQFVKRIEPHDPAETLEYAIRHWSQVVTYVKQVAGISKAPVIPDIGFLLKHCQEVVNRRNMNLSDSWSQHSAIDKKGEKTQPIEELENISISDLEEIEKEVGYGPSSKHD